MVDSLTKLAISMHRKKGAYALLVGSGVSRAAHIPTGWEIVLDLIRQVAAVEGADVAGDPVAWYLQTHGEEPDYGVLLGQIAQTPAERSQILRGYIEPKPEERDLGLKLPTEAHRAISELVAGGHIRVIVTTNFDQLIESSLREHGIVPAVIDSADKVSGTLPLVHNQVTIIKVHGDYIDARIRNTASELRIYQRPINRLLDQIFTEYGLIICGWSGEWDTALVAALRRRGSPWFSTYWISYREPGAAAQALIDLRHASLVTNMDADQFFRRLAESVSLIDGLDTPELVSVVMARATIKSYLDDPLRRIRLHDLVVGDAKRIQRSIIDEPLEAYNAEITQEEIGSRLERYEALTSVMRTMLASGCFWGESTHIDHWVAALERLASLPDIEGRILPDWLSIRHFSTLISLYTAGIAAVARGRFDTLDALLTRVTVLDRARRQRSTIIEEVNLTTVLSEYLRRTFRPGMRTGSVLPQYLSDRTSLWSPLREHIPDDDVFRTNYDVFEYLVGLVYADLRVRQGQRAWGPPGMFAYRRYENGAEPLIASINLAIDEHQNEWPPLQGGMFGGSMDRVIAAKDGYDQMLLGIRWG